MPHPNRAARPLAAALLLSVAACKGGAPAPRQRPPPAVTVAPVEVRDVQVEIRAPVDLRPLFQADVGAKTLGYLDAVLVDRGDLVKKGQLLAVIRPSDLPDQMESARVAFENAKANRARAEALAPSGVVSQQELQNDQSAYAAAQANLQAIATRLGETRIVSPIDGVISQRRLDPGVLVGPNAGTGAILTVQRSDILRVFVPVNEKDAPAVRIGQAASAEFDALPGKRYTGKVVRLSPAFDPVARTVDAEVHLANPGELRPGMYGRGTLITAVHPARGGGPGGSGADLRRPLLRLRGGGREGEAGRAPDRGRRRELVRGGRGARGRERDRHRGHRHARRRRGRPPGSRDRSLHGEARPRPRRREVKPCG